jgi:hypothetical protein
MSDAREAIELAQYLAYLNGVTIVHQSAQGAFLDNEVLLEAFATVIGMALDATSPPAIARAAHEELRNHFRELAATYVELRAQGRDSVSTASLTAAIRERTIAVEAALLPVADRLRELRQQLGI